MTNRQGQSSRTLSGSELPMVKRKSSTTKARSAALRRKLRARMPKQPHAARRDEVLRERLKALVPAEPPTARREAQRARLRDAVPKQPGQPKYRRGRR
ncbi:MAG TPA: hypothetical protein VFU03_04250 [Gemmatimonadales bacterium]|nr:hypothetical protein [Gemmatimonadales bacterium]